MMMEVRPTELQCYYPFLITVWYQGECVDPAGHSVCGLGERLYVRPEGKVECDCDEVS